jgi:hypothetical protein
MACLNYSGLLLASQRVFKNLDDYEDDLEEDVNKDGIDKNASYIYFRPVNEWKK